MTSGNPTPMIRQYRELKAKHPGTLLFFRCGDFYELFFEDSVVGSRELQITLTVRHKERGDPIPMCGVPHHSAANYIAKLVRKGYRVAVCEQTEDPSKAKKLVRREVVRIVTPGTPIDPQLLEAREAIYLASVCAHGETVGAAFLDISTGEFCATQASGANAWARIVADIESYAPRELLFPSSLAPLVQPGFNAAPRTAPLPLSDGRNPTVREGAQTVGSGQKAEGREPNVSESAQIEGSRQKAEGRNPSVSEGARAEGTRQKAEEAPSLTVGSLHLALTPLDDWLWQADESSSLLIKQFGVRSLDGYGLSGKTEAIRAAGACLRYAQDTQRASATHISDIVYFEPQDHLVLDNITVRNLELVESLGGTGQGRSLLDVIDETVTGMGARLLRSWLLRPSISRGEVEARQEQYLSCTPRISSVTVCVRD